MPYNFDEIIERRTSNSIKWTQYPADVLPHHPQCGLARKVQSGE